MSVALKHNCVFIFVKRRALLLRGGFISLEKYPEITALALLSIFLFASQSYDFYWR